MLYNDGMVSNAQKKATTKFENKTYDKFTLRLRKDGGSGFTREDIQKVATSEGVSVNEYIIDAIAQKMGLDLEEIERVPFYE